MGHKLICEILKDENGLKREGKPPKIWTPTLAYPDCYFNTNLLTISINKKSNVNII